MSWREKNDLSTSAEVVLGREWRKTSRSASSLRTSTNKHIVLCYVNWLNGYPHNEYKVNYPNGIHHLGGFAKVNKFPKSFTCYSDFVWKIVQT